MVNLKIQHSAQKRCTILILASIFIFNNQKSEAQTDSAMVEMLKDTFPELVLSENRSLNSNKIIVGKNAINSVAASFDDPSRVLFRFPGFYNTNDQNNEASYRGLPPYFGKWSLNEGEIVNPNHLRGAGIADDFYSQGGGVNMISGNVIDELDATVSPLGSKHGNALSQVSDFDLSEYRPSYVSLSLLGVESGIGMNTTKNKLLLNYRYSFTGVLEDLGVDLGDEKVRYHEGFLGYRRDFKKSSLELNAIYGSSKNDHSRSVELNADSKIKDYQNINYFSKILISSLRYHQYWEKYTMTFFFNYSNRFDRWKSSFPGLSQYQSKFQEQRVVNSGISLSIDNFEVGINYLDFDYYINNGHNMRVYLKDTYEYSDNLSIDWGLSLEYFFRPAKFFNGLNVGVKKKVRDFYYQFSTSLNAKQIIAPKKYSHDEILHKSWDSELSASKLVKNHRLSLGIYAAYLWDLYLIDGKNSLNGAFVMDGVAVDFMSFDASNIGTFARGEFSYTNGWRMIANVNYNSLNYTNPLTGKSEHGLYDRKLSANVNLLKSFHFDKRDKTLDLMLSMTYNTGALRYQPKKTYFYEADYTLPLVEGSPYFRPDFRLVYRKGKWQYSLDIQNFIGLRNDGYELYNIFKEDYESYPQLGLVPVLSCRYQW